MQGFFDQMERALRTYFNVRLAWSHVINSYRTEDVYIVGKLCLLVVRNYRLTCVHKHIFPHLLLHNHLFVDKFNFNRTFQFVAKLFLVLDRHSLIQQVLISFTFAKIVFPFIILTSVLIRIVLHGRDKVLKF